MPPEETREPTLEELLPPGTSLRDAASDRGNWKRRQASYQKILEQLKEGSEEVFTELGLDRNHLKHLTSLRLPGPILVNAVPSEQNASAQDSLLEALSFYLTRPGTERSVLVKRQGVYDYCRDRSCAAEIVPALVEKYASSSRDSLRAKTTAVLLDLVAAEQHETVVVR